MSEPELKFYACRVKGKWKMTGKKASVQEAIGEFNGKFKHRFGDEVRNLGGREEIARDIFEYLQREEQ